MRLGSGTAGKTRVKKKTYKQLAREQRHTIETMRQAGSSQAQIARAIAVAPSTVSRELSRNSDAGGYQWRRAQKRCEQRRRCSRKASKLTAEVVDFMLQQLDEGWTPIQISLALGKEGVSARWFYRLIERDRLVGGRLFERLPFGRRRHRRCKWRRGGPIPNRRDISERPAAANKRSEFGHWEADLIEGAGRNSFVLSVRERRSRYFQMRRVPDKKTDTVCPALIDLLEPFAASFKTLTVDNGGEFADHAAISQALGKQRSVYFARPYRAGDKGSLEQANGLVRRVYPKGTDFNTVSTAQLAATAASINLRPLHVLGGKYPANFIDQLLGQKTV